MIKIVVSDITKEEGMEEAIYYITFRSTMIERIGYNPLRAVLAVKLWKEREERQYEGVPEDVWYQFREWGNPDVYYRKNICGRFPEMKKGIF